MKTQNISKWSYCQNTTQINALAVQIGDLTLYWSYDTVIGFRDSKNGLVVTENIWSVTTGKHLNAISTKHERITNTEFNAKLQTALKEHGLTL